MQKRRLGNSDMEITPIGLGTWAIGGGDWVFGWGPQDDADSVAAIHRGVERGINWLDTAPVYGFGHSEEVCGRALRELPEGERPLVFTKCALVWNDKKEVGHSLDPASIVREVDDSLRRLGVERLDLCQIHWPAFPPGSPAEGLEDGWTTLAGLVEQGKIRHIGVSNFDAHQLRTIQAIAPVTSLQPPYSMLMRGIEDEILPFCQEQGIGVIVYSPMHHGLLSGRMTKERVANMPDSDWRKAGSPAFQEPALTRNLEVVEVLREVGEPYGRSPGEVAIAWTRRIPAVTGAIVGARSAEQVDGFAEAMELELSEAEIAKIGAALPDSVSVLG